MSAGGKPLQGFADPLQGLLIDPTLSRLVAGDEEQKRRAALGLPEAPSIMARIGRGMVDIGQPFRQAYYNAQVWAPEKAAQYQAQRDDELQRYLAGFAPDLPPDLRGRAPDLFRAIGRAAALAPAAAPAGLAQTAATVGPIVEGESLGKPFYNLLTWFPYFLAQHPPK